MTRNDPAKYRRLSEPFPTPEAAQAAWEAFRDDLDLIREKHKIPDVFVAGSISYLDTQGQEITAGASFGFGDSMRHEIMLATALNTVQVERQEHLGKILSRGVIKANR